MLSGTKIKEVSLHCSGSLLCFYIVEFCLDVLDVIFSTLRCLPLQSCHKLAVQVLEMMGRQGVSALYWLSGFMEREQAAAASRAEQWLDDVMRQGRQQAAVSQETLKVPARSQPGKDGRKEGR